MKLKNKSQCYKCKYCWFPEGLQKILGEPMCLYYHDTGKHKDNDENHCNSFESKRQNRESKYKDLKIIDIREDK